MTLITTNTSKIFLVKTGTKKRAFLFMAAFLFLCTVFSKAQCISAGPNNASVFVNDASIGTLAWSNPVNAQTTNNSYASAGSLLGILSSVQTQYLKCTGFGFSIPNTANICGIEVEIERNASGLLIGSSVTDKDLYIIKNNVITGSNHLGGSWPGLDAYFTHGSNVDAWGTTWTPADINSPNFGVAISSKLSAGLASLFLTANVDHVKIRVHYDTIVILPVQIMELNGVAEKERIKIAWKTGSEQKGVHFSIEKLYPDNIWRSIAGVKGEEYKETLNNYAVYDEQPDLLNYYRLVSAEPNSANNYSEIISVSYKKDEPLIYPSLVSDELNIQCGEKPGSVEIYNQLFEKVPLNVENDNRIRLNLSVLPAGLYFVKITVSGKQYLKKIVKK